jgi:hypothetical protein
MLICGRHFCPADIDWISNKIQSCPDLNRLQLSRLFCQQSGWIKPDGGLKEMSCRVALLRLDKSGLIRLPAPRTRPAAVKPVKRTRKGLPGDDIDLDASTVDLSIDPVDRKSAQGRTRVCGEAYLPYAAAGNPRRTPLRGKRAIYGRKLNKYQA